MNDVQETSYITEDGLELGTADELRGELSARQLPVSGNKGELVARLEADDRVGSEVVADDAPADLGDNPGVLEQWATYARADDSRYLVCLGDVSDIAEANRPRTQPESVDDVRLVASATP